MKEGGIMKKTMKKVIAVFVALAMVTTVVSVSPTTSAFAKKIRIYTGTKMKINIGSKDLIVVKGRAKGKSSSKKTVKIVKTKKGKKTKITIKGMKVGKAKIKVKVGKKSRKVKVTVYPKKVTGVRAGLTSTTSAKISWKKTKGASGYYVYRKVNNGGWVKIATVKGAKKTSYINYNLGLGNYYYYKIKAYGKKKLKSQSYSATVSVKTWKLVWNDEFTGDKLDLTKWNNNGATGAGGYGNKELQNYQMDYCKVENSNLVIMPEFKWDKSQNKCVPDSYYSTKLWTKNQKYFRYGKIEFRAKMPKGAGTWAAGWALGQYRSWPSCGEIDVFETTSQLAKTRIPQSLHCKKFNGMPTSSGNKHWDSIIPTATTAYHTYAVIWTPTTISFAIDGKITGTYDPDMYVIDGRGIDDVTVWPYNQPFYLIVNCAIGGTLGGPVSPTYWHKVATSGNIETYRDYLYFDWVRVYQ